MIKFGKKKRKVS